MLYTQKQTLPDVWQKRSQKPVIDDDDILHGWQSRWNTSGGVFYAGILEYCKTNENTLRRTTDTLRP